MQIAKKYLTEGLIQFTILLSLIGVRVDVDSYLNGYFQPPHEINLGPSSAYVQTPFHSLRDNLDGYSVHPKCPNELDYFFASRRLLDEVRTLGSTPRFPTQLNAWLVHQVPDIDRTGTDEPSDDSNGIDTAVPGLDSTAGEHHATDDGQHLPDSGREECQTTRPCSTGACEEDLQEEDDTKEEEAILLSQLTQSSTLEQESLLDSPATLSDLVHPHPIDIDQQWSNFLSLPLTDLDDLDPLVMERLSDLGGAISQDVSLRDAMVTRAGLYGVMSERPEGRLATQRPPPFFRLESANASHSPSGLSLGSGVLPFASVCNATRNVSSSHGTLDGCLDEAVFEQINLLGLEGLDTMDSQIMESLASIDPRVLEDLDSDSGLSLESSSQGPTSPGTLEVSSSSSSSSYCGDEGGATGYSSEVDSIPTKGVAEYTTVWSPVDLSESVWHDHSYSSPAFLHQPSAAMFPHKGIKEEPLSEDEDQSMEDGEMSRDEMRARSMCIPFSALQIVNMPVEEFLEVLEGHGFSSDQVTLLRDIRRRGKNKLAAQNCRKRKLDAISGLQEEVARLHAQRDRLLREKQLTTKTMGAVGQQIQQLTRDVLSRLRDESGQALSSERYTLQCGANGRVVVQPIRKPTVSSTVGSKTDKRKKDKK